ncbi:hypothetical protein EOE18_17540 [Novosphingobium umbonatum]|uniref:Neutral/alkaline non-lysosomal ceramidase N-terminal domain-containing protein n=1 Tax=Novosphingobium umbonatum TaxID=1908524 RepID=A0A437MX82_9SPHN|nr:hypothetical protein EOE18_17540 [Novosphingobium umbonatum]
MIWLLKRSLLLCSLAPLACGQPSAMAQTVPAKPKETQNLLAAASKADITPAAHLLKPPFSKIHDPLFARVLVIESLGKRAVIGVLDVPMMSTQVMGEMTQAIAQYVKIPVEHVLLSASHTHNTYRLDRKQGGIMLPGSSDYVDQVKAATMRALAQALDNLQPARAGSGQGSAHLTAPKSSWSAQHRRWIEKLDRSGAQSVDERVRVLTLENLRGEPLAFLVNYGFNPVVAMALKDQVSGDVPGLAAIYIEQASSHGKVAPVALLTAGAAGNPLYRATDGDHERAGRLLNAMATILGEEVLAVSAETDKTQSALPISAALAQVDCPGKTTTPLNLPDRCAHDTSSTLPPCDFKDSDAPPSSLRMGMLRLGDLAIVHSDADITANVGKALQQRSPLTQTWLASLSYGPMHYIVADSEYPLATYEATATTASQGCAAGRFIDEALSMLNAR